MNDLFDPPKSPDREPLSFNKTAFAVMLGVLLANEFSSLIRMLAALAQ
jgi:hypothetical protein